MLTEGARASDGKVEDDDEEAQGIQAGSNNCNYFFVRYSVVNVDGLREIYASGSRGMRCWRPIDWDGLLLDGFSYANGGRASGEGCCYKAEILLGLLVVVDKVCDFE